MCELSHTAAQGPTPMHTFAPLITTSAWNLGMSRCCGRVQARLGVVAEDDAQALVTHVFSAYIDLMRKVQTTYWYIPSPPHLSELIQYISDATQIACQVVGNGSRCVAADLSSGWCAEALAG